MFKHVQPNFIAKAQQQSKQRQQAAGHSQKHHKTTGNQMEMLQQTTGFFPQVPAAGNLATQADAVSSRIETATPKNALVYDVADADQQMGAFKAIRLTKHDLQIDGSLDKYSTSSIGGKHSDNALGFKDTARSRQERHLAKLNRDNLATVRDSSAGSRERQKVNKSDEGSANDFHKSKTVGRQKDGYNTSKRGYHQRRDTYNNNSKPAKQANFHQKQLEASEINLPQTATGLPSFKGPHYKGGGHNKQTSQHRGGIATQRRKKLENAEVNIFDKEGSMNLSVDQDSSSHFNHSNMNMQSVFNPQIQVSSHNPQMNATVGYDRKSGLDGGPIFPSINNDLGSDYSGFHANSQNIQHKQPAHTNKQFLTTKNSLFSKQSNSVVTQEDQLLQDMKTKESIVHVRQMLQPAENFGELQEKPSMRFKHMREKPKAIFLRRTSSALMTKYSRKFVHNHTVRAAICQTINSNVAPLDARKKTYRHRPNVSVPVSPRNLAAAAVAAVTQSKKKTLNAGSEYASACNFAANEKSNKLPQPQFPLPPQNSQSRNNYDSIYTIGEIEDAAAGTSGSATGVAVAALNQAIKPRDSPTDPKCYLKHGESHNSPSVGKTSSLGGGSSGMKPSYQEPTHAHRKPAKEINRQKMAKAIQAMRHAQLKQGRMNRQSVHRVCEEILSSENIKNDKELEQFGRRYLKKLYSIERDNKGALSVPASQLMSQTLNSFSIGPSMASYRGRVGAKGFSLQHGSSNNTSRFASQDVNTIHGKGVKPFKPSQLATNPNLANLHSDRSHGRGLTDNKGSTLTNKGFDQLPEEDSLMQELLEIQQNQHQDANTARPSHLVVTLDGDLGSSFIEYLTNEAKNNQQQQLMNTSTLLTSEQQSSEGRLEDGITGTQKTIHAMLTPRQKSKRIAIKADKAVAEALKKKQIYPEQMIVAGVVMENRRSMNGRKGDHLTCSSPPETAQERESLVDETPTTQHLVGVPKVIQIRQQQAHLVNDMRISHGGHYEDASISSVEQVRESRLNTGHIDTQYSQLPMTEDGITQSKNHLETSQEQHRKVKKQSPAAAKRAQQQQQPFYDQLFEKKKIMHAMEQNVQLFESFGADDNSRNDFAFEIAQQSTPPSTKKMKHLTETEKPSLRDSYERKVVPLQQQSPTNQKAAGKNTNYAHSPHHHPAHQHQLQIHQQTQLQKQQHQQQQQHKHHFKIAASGLTSRDGSEMAVASSNGPPTKMLDFVSTNNGKNNGSFMNLQEQAQQQELLGASSTGIHSPSIKTNSNKGRKDRISESPPPIDITMTNYAIDKSLLAEESGSLVKNLNSSPSPPDTKNKIGRGRGTQALIQQAQMDPNSFLHTQPIHFDNYYVQARPLGKTIYGKQYKQAQEKLQQSKKKQKLITDKKQQQQIQKEQLQQQLKQTNAGSTSLQQSKDKNVYKQWQVDLGTQFAIASAKTGEDSITPKVPISTAGGDVQSSDQESKSPQQLVVIQHHSSTKNDLAETMNGRRSSTNKASPERETSNEVKSGRVSTTFAQRQMMMAAEESQITIGINQKENFATMGLSEAEIVQNRLGTSGTLNDNVGDFCRASQMTDKDTVDRMPQATAASPNQIIRKPSKIIAEVQTQRTKRKSSKEKDKKLVQGGSIMKMKNQNSKEMAVVQNVQMEELFINGITQHDDSPVKNPLNTDRFIAKFKGKQPIVHKGPNFLNRKKQGLAKTGTDSDAIILANQLGKTESQASPKFVGIIGEQSPLSSPKNNSNNKTFNMMALGQKKQTISLQKQDKTVMKTAPATELARKEGTPTPVSLNALGKNTFNLHMIREKTLALSPLSPHPIVSPLPANQVSHDISAALFVAQNYDRESNNNQTSHGMIHGPSQQLQKPTIGSLLFTNNSMVKAQDSPKVQPATTVTQGTDEQQNHSKKGPSVLSADSQKKQGRTIPLISQEGRAEVNGAQTRIEHRTDRANNDLLSQQQKSDQLDQKRQRVGLSTAELASINDDRKARDNQGDLAVTPLNASNFQRLNEPSVGGVSVSGGGGPDEIAGELVTNMSSDKVNRKIE